MDWVEIRPVDVRAVLLKTPCSCLLETWQMSECYAKFWLQPQVRVNGMLQGGQDLMVKRVSENQFKVGAGIPLMSLEHAVLYVQEYLDRYRVPYHKTTATVPHPFDYNI